MTLFFIRRMWNVTAFLILGKNMKGCGWDTLYVSSSQSKGKSQLVWDWGCTLTIPFQSPFRCSKQTNEQFSISWQCSVRSRPSSMKKALENFLWSVNWEIIQSTPSNTGLLLHFSSCVNEIRANNSKACILLFYYRVFFMFV